MKFQGGSPSQYSSDLKYSGHSAKGDHFRAGGINIRIYITRLKLLFYDQESARILANTLARYKALSKYSASLKYLSIGQSSIPANGDSL